MASPLDILVNHECVPNIALQGNLKFASRTSNLLWGYSPNNHPGFTLKKTQKTTLSLLPLVVVLGIPNTFDCFPKENELPWCQARSNFRTKRIGVHEKIGQMRACIQNILFIHVLQRPDLPMCYSRPLFPVYNFWFKNSPNIPHGFVFSCSKNRGCRAREILSICAVNGVRCISPGERYYCLIVTMRQDIWYLAQ